MHSNKLPIICFATTGFKLYKKTIGSGGFAKQGYPSVAMTDKCKALMNAISSVWPLSTNLLCVFHVLQYVWKWLSDKSHGIALDDRRNLMTNFVMIVYSVHENEGNNA